MTGNDAITGSVSDRLRAALDLIVAPGSQGGQAFTRLLTQRAESEARAADLRRTDGRRNSSVDGLLISCKALFDIAGAVTDAGSAILSRAGPAQKDAATVDRLRQAGAVLVGITHMTEFAFSAVGTNPHFAAPGNPHDRRRIPGGSSSGAAVSVGEAMVDIAIGSDTGGSLRIPAALCGLVGFKPTGSRIAQWGAFSLSSTLDTIGPIARDVAGCAAADSVLSGDPDRCEAASADGFRLVVARGRLFAQSEPEVIEAFEDALARLRTSGIIVDDGALEPVLDGLAEIDKIGTFPSVELAATLRSLGVADLSEVDPNTRIRIEAGLDLTAIDYIHMVRKRAQAIRDFEQRFSAADILVLPTVPIRAPLFADVATPEHFHAVNGLLLRNPRIANLLDCPSISLPLPVADRPVGLMLIGRRLSDRRLLSVARRIEVILAGAQS